MKIIAILLTLLSFYTFADEELLQAKDAFKPSVSIDNNVLTVDFKIADKYYLYKDKINVIALDNTQISAPVFSKGKIKNDDFFGKVEIYRENASVSFDIISSDKVINLEISHQGCADIGVCYPPVKDIIKINNKNNNQSRSSKNFFQTLKAQNTLSDPVDSDIAFVFEIIRVDENNLKAVWQVRDNYYLYSDKINFQIKGAELGNINFPQGIPKKDDFFGDISIYKKQLIVDLPLNNISGKIELTTSYQGCWEGGVCYPPVQKVNSFMEKITTSTISSSVTSSINLVDKIVKPTPVIQQKNIAEKSVTKKEVKRQIIELNEEEKVASIFSNDSVLVVLITFFVFGLGLAFTPCVFPMIPILSGLIIGQDNKSKSTALVMSIVFVLFMALAYTVFGVLAGLFGANLQMILQNPWVLSIFSLVFVALAFSMFGYFELKLPNFMQNKLTVFSNKQKSGNLVGVAIMGFLSALIVGPCIAPPLAGSLIYIGNTGDAVLGGAALFFMSIGMGIPLIFIGAGISKAPKAGGWMDTVKHIFGVVMLGMAIYLLERIVSENTIFILWALLFTITPIVFGATVGIKESTPWQRLFKAIGMIMLGFGILLWILVARGGIESGGDMFTPLKSKISSSSLATSPQKVLFKKVKTLAEFNIIINNTDKLVMLDFYADWCVYCKIYDKKVFTDSRVANFLNKELSIKVDVTKNTEMDQEIMQAFKINAPPAILFFKNGKEIKSKRIIGEKDADEFFAILQKL